MSFSRAGWRLLGGLRQRWWVGGRRGRANTTAKTIQGLEPLNGFLFNEKPLLPGEKRQKEEWENIWVYGMGINFLLVLAIVTLKPDTSVSTWGKQKALERLAAREAGTGSSEEED